MNRIYLMGHSAGAQIILKMATDPRYLNKVGDTPTLFQGVIVLSPPAVDLSQDPATSIAGGPSLAKRTFGLGDNWRTEAAVIPWIKNPKVPFLVLTGAKELKYFHQQSDLLIRGFEKNGVTYQSYEIKGLTHVGMILAASQDGMVADRILKFLKETKNTR